MRKIYIVFSFFGALLMSACTQDKVEVLQPSLKSITDLSLKFSNLGDNSGVYYEYGQNTVVSVPFKTSLQQVIPDIRVSEGATVEPKSGTPLDFEDGIAKTFKIKAQDGSTKTYSITINVRGEVGSGSKIKTFSFDDPFGESYTKTFVYSEFNFVNQIICEEGGNTYNYQFVYNDKNQIIALNCESKQTTIEYVYDDRGLIIESLETVEGLLTEKNNYKYNVNNDMVELKVTDMKNQKVGVITYEYTDGNVTKENRYGDEYTATIYDDKKNPFYNIYPIAYAKIEVGLAGREKTNKNNPINVSITDNGIVYVYNSSGYPVSSKYTYFGGFASVNVTYTYYKEE